MADKVFDIALGRSGQLARNVAAGSPANSALVVVLLKAQETPEDTLLSRATLADVLSNGSTEADFTNYARKTVTGGDVTVTVDNANDQATIAIPNQLYTSAGGASNNSLVAALVCYDDDTGSGTDANIIPISKIDLSYTTDGTSMMLVFSSTYFHRSERG